LAVLGTTELPINFRPFPETVSLGESSLYVEEDLFLAHSHSIQTVLEITTILHRLQTEESVEYLLTFFPYDEWKEETTWENKA
jgi:hypothetical protein